MTKLKKILKEFTDLGSIDHNQIDTNYVYPGGTRIVPELGLLKNDWTQIDFPVANNPYGASDSYAIKTQTVHDAGFKDLSDEKDNTKKDDNISQISKNADQVHNSKLKTALNKIKHFEKHKKNIASIQQKINKKFSQALNKNNSDTNKSFKDAFSKMQGKQKSIKIQKTKGVK